MFTKWFQESTKHKEKTWCLWTESTIGVADSSVSASTFSVLFLVRYIFLSVIAKLHFVKRNNAEKVNKYYSIAIVKML